jgi:glycine dehydrogenase
MTQHFSPKRNFANRHLGPSDSQTREMLEALGLSSLDELVHAAVPESILLDRPLDLPEERGEQGEIASQNRVMRSYIGMGYHGTITPPVILRNVMENPGWYTQYTPYQAEISQGRLEALLNFQTMIADLTVSRSPTRACSTRAPRRPRR